MHAVIFYYWNLGHGGPDRQFKYIRVLDDYIINTKNNTILLLIISIHNQG
jgi:hypothetical protein